VEAKERNMVKRTVSEEISSSAALVVQVTEASSKTGFILRAAKTLVIECDFYMFLNQN